MPVIEMLYEYQGITFTIFRDQTDGTDGPVEVFYWWERDDLPEDWGGQRAFLPSATVAEALEDARLDGAVGQGWPPVPMGQQQTPSERRRALHWMH